MSRSAPESRVVRWFLRLGCWWSGCEPRPGAGVWASVNHGYDESVCRYCHRPIWAVSLPRELNPQGARRSEISRSAVAPNSTSVPHNSNDVEFALTSGDSGALPDSQVAPPEEEK